MRIDLNCDLGEGYGVWRLGDDEALLDVVTSANVACGFHAGDPQIMTTVVRAAAARVSRSEPRSRTRTCAASAGERSTSRRTSSRPTCSTSSAPSMRWPASAGTRVSYVKAHGALYHRITNDPEQAGAVVEALCRFRRPAAADPARLRGRRSRRGPGSPLSPRPTPTAATPPRALSCRVRRPAPW